MYFDSLVSWTHPYPDTAERLMPMSRRHVGGDSAWKIGVAAPGLAPLLHPPMGFLLKNKKWGDRASLQLVIGGQILPFHTILTPGYNGMS